MITLSTIVYAPVGAAWKTPRMRGYLAKVEQTPDSGYDAAFGLEFVDTETETANKVYVFQKRTGTDAYTCTGPLEPDNDDADERLVLDAWLLELILSGDWRQGNASDFAEQLSGDKLW